MDIAASGGLPPSEHLSFIKGILFGLLFWELNPEVLVSLRLKASVIEKAGRVPFELYPDICLTTEEKQGKHRSG
jgi:hypothetical protein